MSYWDSNKQVVVRFLPKGIEGYPNWVDVDCGCCAGLEWGGEEPRECSSCNGSGWYAVHTPTGTCAMWPGGPLLGARFTQTEIQKILESLNDRL